jgi:peptide/nickel transport system substrate-binding protein
MQDGASQTVTRRAFLAGSLAMGGLALAGCGGSSKPSGAASATGGSSPAASAAATGSQVKTLRCGVVGDVVPAQIFRYTSANQPLRRTVFDYLLDKNADGTYTPQLATDWDWSSDGKSLVINLRDGVTYHNGRTFGPDDVVATINAAQDKAAGAQVASLLKVAKGVTKSGANQVTVSFDAPFPAYLDAFAMMPVIDSTTYADVATGKQVIGTGPFTWKSWTAGSKLEMSRFASYWQSNRPYLENLEFDIFTNSQAILAAMQSGSLDMVDGMITRDAVTLKNQGGFTITPSPGYDIYVGVNTSVKPLDDVRVRQAIAYALDRNRIVSQVYNGLAQPSCVPWPSTTPGVTDAQVNHYTYDVAKAKSLISDAGVAGTELQIVAYPGDPAMGSILDIVQYGLSQIGLKTKTVTYDTAEYAKRNQAGELPALWISIVPLCLLGPVTALLTSNPIQAGKNASHFTPPEYNSLVQAVTGASTPDAEAKAIGVLTDYMLEQAFHNTVVQAATPIVGVSGLKNAKADLTLAVVLTDTTLSK